MAKQDGGRKDGGHKMTKQDGRHKMTKQDGKTRWQNKMAVEKMVDTR